MDRFISVTVCIFTVVLFASCTTVPSVKVQSASSVQEQPAPSVKKTSVPAPELFSDWEYKGFGRALPKWVELYFRGGEAAVRDAWPECAGKQVLIVSSSGKDADQADQTLRRKTADNPVPDGYELKEKTWVRLQSSDIIAEYGGNNYVSVCVYIK
ncbi:MAG: hypothetical protein M0P01_00220 [Treponema sp.]|nr:hypothetical protein [Treponema sp.]